MKHLKHFTKRNILAGLVAGAASLVFSTGVDAQSTRTVCATGCDHSSIANAVTWVNNTSNSITGGVIFSVASGHNEIPSSPIVITREGTQANFIRFEKASGASSPVVVKAHTGNTNTNNAHLSNTANGDAIITLNGADYVTFDGIDIAEDANNKNSSQMMEYGFLIINNSATNGAQNNIIRNASITLGNNSNGPVGVFQTTPTAPTNTNGANSNNIYQNLVITGASAGVFLNNTTTTTNCEDVNTRVRNVTIGSTATDNISYNGSTYGIRMNNQRAATIERNIIRNITSTTNNSTVTGIDFVNVAGSNNVSNNVIYKLNSTTGGSNANILVKGIAVNGNSGEVNIDFNTVVIATVPEIGNANLEFTATSSKNSIRNNIFVNNTINHSSVKHYVVVMPTATSIGGTNSVSNFNDLFIASGTNNFIGKAGSSDAKSLTNWQGAISGITIDANSVNVLPVFTGADNYRPDVANVNSWYLNGAGLQISTINADLLGNSIPTTAAAGTPDMGAYQFTPNMNVHPSLNVTHVTSTTTELSFGTRKVATINWTGTKPTIATANYFPAMTPPGAATAPGREYQYFNSYLEITASGGGSYSYNITFHYYPNEIGNVNLNTGVQLAKQTGNVWDVPTQGTPGANSVTATGLTSFSRFTGTGTINPLPVSLISFEAALKGNVVNLSWKTSMEINNDRFEIERSENGIDFITVGEVSGNGNSTNIISYGFEDKVPATGSAVLYYRLRQVDYNGDFEYFGVKRVVLSTAVVDAKTWFNNSTDKIQVALNSNVSGQLNLSVVDIQGRVVANQVTAVNNGATNIMVDMQSLPNGIYTVVLVTESGIQASKVVKF